VNRRRSRSARECVGSGTSGGENRARATAGRSSMGSGLCFGDEGKGELGGVWRLREGRERGVCVEVLGWKGAARRKGCGGGGADCGRDAERASGRTIRVWTASTARAKNYPLAL
jgi:hypothetical protein